MIVFQAYPTLRGKFPTISRLAVLGFTIHRDRGSPGGALKRSCSGSPWGWRSRRPKACWQYRPHNYTKARSRGDVELCCVDIFLYFCTIPADIENGVPIRKVGT